MGESFANMKSPLRSALLVLAVVVVLAGLTLAGLPRGLMLAIAAGMLLVGVVILGWQFVMKLADRGKSGPFAKLIAGSAGGVQVADPALKARLDDLRKKFEEGIEKFRAAGKNLYAIPWYLLVGEPGSGKSFLVRKAGKTGNWFPPGLQDELQGTGGTINMHWWFTNYAVVVDTAGKMLMQEVKPGENSEWREFLKLLKVARPNCPINGLLLVIPADTLIKDKPEQIEKKAGTIARQLDMIQRALDVRFPVFVLITKCDLITGFRDFFDAIDDPTAQHQILGWSNASDLDTVFNPDEVDQHLGEVRDRLMRRRAGMMLDPVHSEGPKGRRLDELDSLFALPESMMKLAPRLRRYLEMVFVAGEWSPKPLFLRGIYFTSSVQEGSELDEMLADALGIPIDAINPIAPDEKERALFLRDVFSQKIFREKGLVTRATSVKKQQRQRRMVVLAGALVTTLAFVGLTFVGATQLSGRIEEPRRFWEDVARRQTGAEAGTGLSLLEPGAGGGMAYRGDREIELTDYKKTVRLGSLAKETRDMAAATIEIPPAFRPLSAVLGDVTGNLQGAQRAAAHSGMTVRNALTPVLDAARAKFADPALVWDASASAAMAELIRLERAGASAGATPERVTIDLDRLYRFVLPDEQYARFLVDREGIQKALDWSFVDPAGPKLAWPPAEAGAGSERARAAVSAGLSMLASAGGVLRGSTTYARTDELRAALAEYLKAEGELLAVDDAFQTEASEPRTRAEYDTVTAALWAKAEAAAMAREAVARGIEVLGGQSLPGVRELAQKARDEMTAAVDATYTTLLEPLEGDSGSPLRAALEKQKAAALADVAAKVGAVEQELIAIEPETLSLSAADQSRPLDVRSRLLTLAVEALRPASGGAAAGSLESTQQAIDQIARGAGRGARTEEAARLARFAVRLAGRERAFAALSAALSAAPDSEEKVAAAVREAAATARTLERPSIDLTDAPTSFDPSFHPDAATAVLASFADARARLGGLNGGGGGARVLDAERLESLASRVAPGFEAYAKAYVEYWSAAVFKDVSPKPFGSWDSARRELAGLGAFPINDALSRLGEHAIEALSALPAGFAVSPERDASLARVRAGKGVIDRELTAAVQEAIDNAWGKLPADPRGAREQIAVLTAEVFEARYLPRLVEDAPGSAATYASAYWSAVFTEGVKSLSAAAGEVSRDALSRLKTDARKFPLVRDSQDALTPAALAQAADDLALLTGSTPLGVSGERTIRAGDRTKRSRVIDEQLDVLTGEALLTPEVRDWARKLGPVVQALAGEQRVRTIEISTPDATAALGAPTGDEKAQPAESRFKFLDLAPGPAREGKGRKPSGLSGQALGTADFGNPEALAVRVFQNERDRNAAGEATVGEAWAGPWGAVSAMLDESARPGSDARSWQVPVRFTVGNRSYYMWLTLRFGRDMPSPENWPTSAGWPD